MNYYELSKLIFKAQKKEIREQSEFIIDKETREKFIVDQSVKLQMKKYTEYSSLLLNFNQEDSLYIVDKLKKMRLPNLNAIRMDNVADSPQRFYNFILKNAPEKVNEFSVFGAKGINLSPIRISQYAKLLSNRVKKLIRLSGFEMSVYNLEALFDIFDDVESIDFRGCKLTNNSEILLENEFKNLKSLNLEGIGL